MGCSVDAQDPSALVRRGHLPFADSAKGRKMKTYRVSTLGYVPIPFEMICSMTSSAPPPIEARRESRKARAVGASQR